jgi:redox-sensitive bicupin YhaK (pirin superfamily)
MGPAVGTLSVGPHPHIGLQTVTWLLEGEVVHRDSLGVVEPIRPGQLNLMTAGRGVSHAEEGVGPARVHGAQLWVAQPEATRHGDPAFEHHDALPQVSIGDALATVLVGELAGERSPARHDTPLLGAEVRLAAGGRAELGLDVAFEHGIAVLAGAIVADGAAVRAGQLLHLGSARAAVAIEATEPAIALLLGGEPLGEELVMWWNFVARSFAEVDDARAAWEVGERFGSFASSLPRVPAPPR